jgi:hypothetical protein
MVGQGRCDQLPRYATSEHWMISEQVGEQISVLTLVPVTVHTEKVKSLVTF